MPAMNERHDNPGEGTAPLHAVLVFGSESSGLPEPFYERYRDALVRIPMPGPHARSLNLANAASIALYEAYRQLRAPRQR